MKCPVCCAGLAYLATKPVTPSTEKDFYECPDPDCEVATVSMVYEL